MKSIMIALALTMTVSTAFANELSCSKENSDEQNFDNTVQLIEKGYLSLGVEYTSLGGGINEATGEAVSEAIMDLGKNLVLKRKSVNDNVTRSLATTAEMSRNTTTSAIRVVTEKASTGLSELEAANLKTCRKMVFEKYL